VPQKKNKKPGVKMHNILICWGHLFMVFLYEKVFATCKTSHSRSVRLPLVSVSVSFFAISLSASHEFY